MMPPVGGPRVVFSLPPSPHARSRVSLLFPNTSQSAQDSACPTRTRIPTTPTWATAWVSPLLPRRSYLFVLPPLRPHPIPSHPILASHRIASRARCMSPLPLAPPPHPLRRTAPRTAAMGRLHRRPDHERAPRRRQHGQAARDVPHEEARDHGRGRRDRRGEDPIDQAVSGETRPRPPIIISLSLPPEGEDAAAAVVVCRTDSRDAPDGARRGVGRITITSAEGKSFVIKIK
jgi:hypothetical protein